MNTLQVDYFLAAAEHGNLTHAAEHFMISQPAMSRVIRSLERELGVVLFEKTNRGIRLTPAGQIIYDALSKSKQLTSDAVKYASKINPGQSGSIRLGVLTGLDLYSVFYTHLIKFSESFPGIEIVTESDDFYDLREQLRNKRMDMIITIAASLTDRHNLDTRTICHSPRMLIYSKNHPVAKTGQLLTPQSFKDVPFYGVFPNNPMAETLILRYCEQYGFIPRIKPVNNIESLIANVQNLNGVAIVDSYSRELTSPHIGAIQMDSYEELVLTYSKTNSNPALRTFIDWFSAEHNLE